MRKRILIFINLLLPIIVFGQLDTIKIPLDRQYFHERIVDLQNEIDKSDKKQDGIYTISEDETINLQVSYFLFNKIRELRYGIETNTALATRNEKVRYLRYIESVLREFQKARVTKQIKPIQLPELITSFEKVQQAILSGTKILPIIKVQPYALARINANVFVDDKDYTLIQQEVYLKYLQLNPDKILETIAPYVSTPFADSLIAVVAHRNPGKLYTYGQNKSSPVGRLIHASKDPAVQMISKLSTMPTALNYFPFLDQLLTGKLKIEDIEKYVGDGEKTYDSLGYYKLLVATEIGYAERLQKKDTPVAMFGVNGLRAVLKNRALRHFIIPINELHESPVNIRMRAIQPLSATELYYTIVMGETDIYTSSYKHSFTRLQQLQPNGFHGDSLLQNVQFDYFKKFIKMAANYNQLDFFLASMTPENANNIMYSFVDKLDEGSNLEDAVDVADAYSSIVNPELRTTILKYVMQNEAEAITTANTKGSIIYGLLKTIFESANDSTKVDLTAAIGIPSIYDIENKTLQDEQGRIVQQVFFYGDEDGKTFFPPFVNSFTAADWDIKQMPEWVEIKSKKGNVFIYANKPLDSDRNLDDSAQVHLAAALKKAGMNPSIVVHRGHSYWLQGTIARMPADAKIVVLGSCGGYKNLSEILAIAPEAHIISTKEIGAGDINRPILNYMNQALIGGKALEWRTMWASLTKFFAADPSLSIRESWDDYVPPYKNLGAIFIKAVNKKIDEEGLDLSL